MSAIALQQVLSSSAGRRRQAQLEVCAGWVITPITAEFRAGSFSSTCRDNPREPVPPICIDYLSGGGGQEDDEEANQAGLHERTPEREIAVCGQ